MKLNWLLGNMFGRPREESGTSADAFRALLSEGGVFAQDPAPVAVVGRDGRVISANFSVDKLGNAFGPNGALAPMIAEAIDTRTMRRDTMEIDASNRGGHRGEGVWELIVLPMPDGENALVQGRDISHDRALRDALVDSRKRYKDLVDISSDFIWETDAGGNFVFVSPGGALGYAADELVRRHPREFVPKSLAAEVASPFMAKTRVTEVDVWFQRADGGMALLLASAAPIVNGDGAWMGARGVCRDVTEEHDRDTTLAAAQTRERLLAYIIRSMHDEVNPANMLAAAAAATGQAMGAVNCRIWRGDGPGSFSLAAEFGAPPVEDVLEEALIAKSVENGEPIMGVDADRHMMCIATSYRKTVNGAISITRVQEGGGWLGDDVTLACEAAMQLAIAIEQIDHHSKLEELSRTDELTGLLNRRAFYSEMESRIRRGNGKTRVGALFFVDLDNFKLVNDVHGHHRGDEALTAVSRILVANTRPGDLVGRLGGDEFALWFDRTDERSAVLRAEELLETARGLAEYSGDEARPLSMSIGIAAWDPGADEGVSGLTDRADTAMYEIKRGSKSGFVVAPPFGVSPQSGGEVAGTEKAEKAKPTKLAKPAKKVSS